MTDTTPASGTTDRNTLNARLMQDTLLTFDSINGLFGFLTSAALTYDEIVGLSIKEVDGAYFLAGEQLPERLRTAGPEAIERLKALCLNTFDLAPMTVDGQILLAGGTVFQAEDHVFSLRENGTAAPVRLSDDEYLFALHDVALLQQVVSFFFRLNHVGLRVLALLPDDAFPFRYLVWVEGYTQGVPIQFTLSEARARRQWALFLKLDDAPEGRRWFAQQGFAGPRPSPAPDLTPQAVRTNPLLVIYAGLKFYFDADAFRPVLDFVHLDIDAALMVRTKALGMAEAFDVPVRLRKKTDTAWRLSQHLHRLDKKTEELSFQLERIAKLRRKLGEAEAGIGRYLYLYLYDEDDEAFPRLLRERPYAEKAGLCYYNTKVLGRGDTWFHLLVSRKLFPYHKQGGEADGEAWTAWNVSREYLPLAAEHRYYLHPEWYFAGVWIFLPMAYEVVPYLELDGKPDHVRKLVRGLLTYDYDLDYDDDEAVDRFIKEHVFILTPHPDRTAGALCTTILEKDNLVPLVECFNFVNAHVAGAEDAQRQVISRVGRWVYEELDSQMGEELQPLFDGIRDLEHQANVEFTHFHWELADLRKSLDKKLRRGQAIDAETKALLKTYKSHERTTRSLLRALKRITFGRLVLARWDVWQHVAHVHAHLAQLHSLVRKESLIKGWFEWRLKARMEKSERRIERMNKRLSRLARRLEQEERKTRWRR